MTITDTAVIALWLERSVTGPWGIFGQQNGTASARRGGAR
jgi:hypothetical protein